MNGNSHHESVLSSGYIERAEVPFWRGPGFVIPLVQSRYGSNASYIQRVDGGKKICGFVLFPAAYNSVPIVSPIPVRVGIQEVFAIVDPFGDAHAGTQKDLAGNIRRWLSKVESPLSRMNFARFCGDRRTEMGSAQQAFEMKIEEFNSEDLAVSWFVHSAVSRELFDIMRARSVRGSRAEVYNGEAFMTVRVRRASVDISLPTGIRQSNKAYSARLSPLLELVKAVTGRSVDVITEFSRLDYPKTDARIIDNVDRILRRVSSLKRQEERVAILLEETLRDPRAGQAVLERHIERAGHAAAAIDLLRSTMLGYTSGVDVERMLEPVLREIILRSYPLQRGRLLLALSQHLSAYSLLTSTIRGFATRSRAREVLLYRDRILRELD